MDKVTEAFGPFFPLIFTIVGLIIGLVVGAVGIDFPILGHMNTLIENKLNDEKVISKLVANIRPSVIFDDNSSIIADIGAMEYIEKINVELKEDPQKVSIGGKTHFPDQIIISPKRFLSIHPLLESLDASIDMHVERGQKYDLIYKIENIFFPSLVKQPKLRFRLEVIRPRD